MMRALAFPIAPAFRPVQIGMEVVGLRRWGRGAQRGGVGGKGGDRGVTSKNKKPSKKSTYILYVLLKIVVIQHCNRASTLVPSLLTAHGRLAQLDRASDYESGGRRFEPCIGRLFLFGGRGAGARARGRKR